MTDAEGPGVRRPRPPRRRRVIIGAIIGALVVASSVAVWSVIATDNSAIPLGHGTASATWTFQSCSCRLPPERFSGRIDSLKFSGTYRLGGTNARPPTSLQQLYHQLGLTWKGAVDGRPFNLRVSLSTTPPTVGFVVTGTFGSEPVRVVAGPGRTSSNFVPFSGTVGSMTVTGMLNGPHTVGHQARASASFTLSR